MPELTGYKNAEHILEMAGGSNLPKSLLAVSNGGRISGSEASVRIRGAGAIRKKIVIDVS